MQKKIRLDVKEGDVIVFTTKKSFPHMKNQTFEGVVEEIQDHHVDCGVDGRIHKSNIVKVKNSQDK